MCWVSFYESDDFQGGFIQYNSPVKVEHMGKGAVKLSNGKSAGDQIDSLKLGPDSWLEVFKDGEYEDKVRRFNPNTIVRKLDDYDIGDCISSFKLYDAEPASWPGPSKPNSQKNTLVIDLKVANVVDKFGDLVATLISEIPQIGGILSGLTDFLWPDMIDKKKVWNEIKEIVSDMIRDLIDQQKVEILEKKLDGLGNMLESYNATSYYTSQKGHFFSGILQELDDEEPYFFDQSSPWATLTYFVNMGTIEIGVLREQYLYYPQIYSTDPNHPVTDPDQAYHLQKLQLKIQQYSEGAQAARQKAMDWRLAQIGVEYYRGSTSGYRAYDNYDGWKGGGHSWESDAETDAERRKEQVSKDYGASLDVLLYPAKVWRYFDPTVTDLPTLKPIEVISGPYGGKNGTSFDDKPSGKPLTKIVILSGSRIDGIEAFYEGVSGGIHGGTGGNIDSVIELEEEETIIAAYGKSGDSMDQLFFRTSKGRDIGGGGKDGDPWSSLPPLGVEAYLGWISGVQGSKSLESLTFHWIYWKKY